MTCNARRSIRATHGDWMSFPDRYLLDAARGTKVHRLRQPSPDRDPASRQSADKAHYVKSNEFAGSDPHPLAASSEGLSGPSGGP